ncbi:P-type conjugative transfer protein TrbL [Thauera mechernichensis]|uniref:P-type conjugative transfer protein TrbL n=1 Tax=Thauera mechernichensis TaxID=82788 RepID=A0ABW3WBC1_9RHOO|nr:P-type conjugative transfer protein TrbL [Thauera mechernichensis]MDG3066575.1 P-type conjugative transfer protein TrbL [Thauera mechernichensis]
MKINRSTALVVAALMLVSGSAFAQLSFHDPATNRGILDQVVTEFAARASGWQAVVMNAATWLFWTLGTISLAWTGGMLILRKADIGEFFAEFARFILFFGFYLWLLRNGPAIADAIIGSMRQIGESAIGVSGLSPSGVVDVGFMIWKQAVTNLSAWQPIDSFVGVVLSAGILLLLAVVAVNLLLLFVSGWILMYAGIFFLGFGGSRWTSEMALSYFRTVLGVAVQLFVMTLLLGVGHDLLSSFYAKMNKGALNFEELGVMLVFCLALLLLITRVPPLVAGIITGGGVAAAGGVGNFSAGAVAGAGMGAVGMAATAAGMAGAAVMSGAQNIAGGVSAVKEAFDKAQAGIESGGGQMPSLGQTASSGGRAAAGEASGSAFAQAAGFGGSSSAGAGAGLGRAAALAKGTAANLATGAGSVIKDKAVKLASDFKEGADQSLPGKVASAIRGGGADNSVQFEGNSLTGTEVNEEVATFVNKSKGAA